MFLLRFDFRLAPASPASMGELYRTSLEMCEWGEANGAMLALFSEHHASDDGYLPSPLVIAGAAAARTTTLPISIGALLLLMYDPVKAAEDISVLDHLSGGRVSYTVGLGYRDEEYAMFGVDPASRGKEITERLSVLQRALRGESFEWRGRPVSVTPAPATPGGPFLAYGGGSPAAARRAARLGMAFVPQTSDPTLADIYDAAAAEAGTTPGMTMAPGEGSPTSVFVASDVDRAWADWGPYLLHDATAYRAWMGADNNSLSKSDATTIDALRAEEGPYRIVTPDGAVDLIGEFGMLSLQPLCGGLPPAMAWESLHLIEREVLPQLG